MKIIKRNGSEAVFDITKIIAAITKANKVVPDAQRLTKQQIIEISDERRGDPGHRRGRHHGHRCV